MKRVKMRMDDAKWFEVPYGMLASPARKALLQPWKKKDTTSDQCITCIPGMPSACVESDREPCTITEVRANNVAR